MKNARLRHALLSAVFIALPVAEASAIERVAVHRDWVVFKAEENGNALCYATSPPTETLPTDRNHGNTLFFVVNRPQQKVSDEPHFRAGYKFRPGSTVEVRVDANSFTMLTDDDGAWLENAEKNANLIGKMKAGSEMQVFATSARGTSTSYRFSLLGVTKAIESAMTACR